MQHSFDISIAEKFGVNVAIFLNNLVFWIQKNQANNKHFYEGRYWTYNSIEAFTRLFPYWSFKQVRLILNKLEKEGLIVTSNFNSTPYDRTKWYALSDIGHNLVGLPILPRDSDPLPEEANQVAKKGKPIPDIKPDIKQKILKTYVQKPVKSRSQTKPHKPQVVDNSNVTSLLPVAKAKSGKQKLRSSDDELVWFMLFWTLYPRKQKKAVAQRLWEQRGCEDEGEAIVNQLRRRLATDWKELPRQYVPLPDTYIRQERWLDEPDEVPRKKETPTEIALRLYKSQQAH